MFFDSVDSLSDVDSVCVFEENVGSRLDYGIWMNEPQSIHRRKLEFLRKMGLGGDKELSLERVTECSGAVSVSGLSGSVDECVISVGRETEGEAFPHVDDLDLQGSITCCYEKEEVVAVERICNEISSVKGSKKATIAAKQLSRWWSHLCKKPAERNAMEPDFKTPNMNEMKVRCNKKKCVELSALYVGQEIKAHKGFILTMKFSPDGQYLASGGQDGVVRIWRVATKDTSTKYSVPESDNNPKTKFSTISAPDKIFHIDELPYRKLYGHSGDILNLAWSKTNVSQV